MRSAKSTNSLANPQTRAEPIISHSTMDRRRADSGLSKVAAGETSPICRCRVMYLGSSVPHITKDGLQGIQEPLKELYPDRGSLESGNAGIDSWLSVWSNGILIENIDDSGHGVKRFFKIEALHYCAAVKFVPLSQQQQLDQSSQCSDGTGEPASLPRFLPLDSPHARLITSSPPIFASIIRRTTGIKVLECHAFVCKREAAANALVRCCFHAYADTMYAKQIGAELQADVNNNNNNRQVGQSAYDIPDAGQSVAATRRRSKSIAALNDPLANEQQSWPNQQQPFAGHKLAATIDRNQASHSCDTDEDTSEALRRQQKLSKSMHQLNEPSNRLLVRQQQQQLEPYTTTNHSASVSCLSQGANNNGRHQVPQQQQQQQYQLQHPHPPQPFYNQQQAARVPSYPPQSLIDGANNGGTLRSIRSMAANSIASTLLRSKKHAKAMSMAQLNQQHQQQQQQQQQYQLANGVTSFHQPHSKQAKAAATLGGKSHGLALGMAIAAGQINGHHQLMMPPVPPMFLPNLPADLLNGSQTMKPLSKSATMLPYVGPPVNGFAEPLSQKEVKKLLKKSSKYGLNPSKLAIDANGLPLRPAPPQLACHIAPQPPAAAAKSKALHPPLVVPEMYAGAELQPDGLGMAPAMPFEQPPGGNPLEPMALKPILVKPNPEFLKSKAGKKWLKQQKEFKKLLPPHLDGLPIIFGPPPADAMEPVPAQSQMLPPPPPPAAMFPVQPNGLPVMDSAGYYNPHPFYGNMAERASAASTLVRYSPGQEMVYEMTDRASQPFPRHAHQHGNSRSSISSSLATSQRDYYHGSELNPTVGQNHQRYLNMDQAGRRHMVEQSVISLGDENDCDEDDDPSDHQRQDGSLRQSEHQQQVANGTESRARQSRSNHQTIGHNSNRTGEQQAANYRLSYEQHQQPDYEQIQSAAQPADDQDPDYSSGIYKRGHLNERAFSHSIRQELGKGSGSRVRDEPSEYAARNGIPTTEPDHRQSYPAPQRNHQQHHGYHQMQIQMQQQQQQVHCHAMDAGKRLARNDRHASHQGAGLQTITGKRDQNDDYYTSHHQHNGKPSGNNNQNHANNSDTNCNGKINDPINELTHRLDNQLNLKSFPNSRIRSHM